MTERSINSRYKGSCRICGQSFPAGTAIYYSKELGTRHILCPEVELPPDAITVTRESDPYHQGEVFRYRPRSGEAMYLTVLTCQQRYIPEDGMSLGLTLDDSGYLYTAQCREATEEESAPLRQREAHWKAVDQARRRLGQIRDTIRTNNELPQFDNGEWWNPPTSQEVHWGNPNTGYGGGSWFAITSDWIMFVQNNGADGDTWSANNYHTGGAGAIAWGIRRTEELAQEIRSLAVQVDQPMQEQRELQLMIAWANDPIVDDVG